MHPITAQVRPALAARLDWALLDEFVPEQFQGEQRAEYEAAWADIERQRDNQPR